MAALMASGAPIRRLLIANRGEIAVRIARTAHRLGISTVGVHSDADARALHVAVVDESVALGGSSPAESYLRADLVLAAALDTGCDAVHPGYGFLAENAEFAAAVVDAGLIWVGPTAQQIALLGDKIAAKQAAIAAGVPTAPVFAAAPGAVPDDVPLPALVKAAAGGGGRGMRIVRERSELADAVAAAAREAESAFGDPTVFIEPYLERGRHVEVQILGDTHGNVVHLGDRDCSVQRRNQKVLEEAPAPGLDPATRAALAEGALALARHVGYVNAGTVEFMVGDDGTVNFLEVNTRLQVEHPVTEAVTGLDLVELQLWVAAGAPLPLTQEQVVLTGHAIEARLVAEDPAAGWLPSTGTVERFEVPGDVRCDAAVVAGSEVSADYDSLVAKVIAHAPDRTTAAAVLARALRATEVVGPRTNLSMLVSTLSEADFIAGGVTTRYLDEHPDVLTRRWPDGHDRTAALVAAVMVDRVGARGSDRRWGFAPAGWRNLAVQGRRARWTDVDTGDEFGVEVVTDRTGATQVLVGDPPGHDEAGALLPDPRASLAVSAGMDGDVLSLEIDGRRRTFVVTCTAAGLTVASPQGASTWAPCPRFEDHDAAAAGAGPIAPLPGTVLSVHVAAGERVADGDPLVVIEAMKMEHVIRAGHDATVTEVRVAVGDRVDAGDLLVLLDTD
jgi:propionyl-CoA carboxylase alpha chain